MKRVTKTVPLPSFVCELLWEFDVSKISFPKDAHTINKILSVGRWEAVEWLREQIGDSGIRSWIMEHEARGMSPSQLRFWESEVGLDPNKVAEWIRTKMKNPWYNRLSSPALNYEIDPNPYGRPNDHESQ